MKFKETKETKAGQRGLEFVQSWSFDWETERLETRMQIDSRPRTTS